MQEILSSIKLVKFYAWEDCFMKQVKTLRDKEIKLLGKGAFLKSVNLMIVFVIPPIIALVLFSAYVAVKGKLDSTVAFTTLSLFNTLRFPLVVLPRAIKTYAEAKASIQRLESFLLREETSSQLSLSDVGSAPELELRNDKGTIDIHDISVGYHKRAEKGLHAHTIEVLSSVTLTINDGEHCAIVGPVASGKSSLLMGMLGEARVIRGDMSLTGRPAYVPQTPWIQAGTVRSNILFGLPYDEARYNQVVFACALTRDMEILPQGDLTSVAPRGINLSGGQRQRISLARAAYCGASLYLLDNPLSAVDWFTSNHIMTHCVKGIMKDATVLMVTHQLDLLPLFHKICVIRDRISVYSGPYSSAVLQEFFPNLSDEEINHGSDAAQANASSSAAAAAAAPNAAAAALALPAPQAKQAPADPNKQPMPDVLDHTAISDVKHVTMGPFKAWFMAGGTLLGVFSICIYIITQVARIISDWFISVWTADRFNHSNDTYNLIYGLLVATFLVLLFTRGVVFYHFALKAATRIHNLSFDRILRAPMAVFTLTPLGNVLTLFSKDQDTVDEAIPDTIYLTFIYGLILLTTLILVCVILPLYAIVAGLLALATVLLSWFYIRAASSLKELVLSTSAPLFSFVAESMDGIAVIRAFRADQRMCEEFLALVNNHHGAMYCLDALQLWLGLRLGAMGSILVFATALFCVLDRDNLEPAAVGLAISNSLQKLIFYTWFVRGAADVVAHFGAVDRIQYFTETMPSERATVTPYQAPPNRWPERGSLTFEHAVMRYLPWTDPALRGVSFHINHGEKIGVVGRTGSGKSSMLMALFRMNELEAGRIFVDGRNISELSLYDLRSRLSIIPQEPVMFKGTIRTNLDPFHEADDHAVWEALEICQMKQFVLNLPHQLESPVTLCGENFSLGQRQLICLGRAYLKKSSILCLDEATAAMDLETDALIQRTLQIAFAERTVITIAHRLDTVIESDRILVLDNGYVVEFDSPTNLLRKRDSSFSRLVDQVGSHRAVLEERASAHEQFRSQELAILRHREQQMASLKRSGKITHGPMVPTLVANHPSVQAEKFSSSSTPATAPASRVPTATNNAAAAAAAESLVEPDGNIATTLAAGDAGGGDTRSEHGEEGAYRHPSYSRNAFNKRSHQRSSQHHAPLQPPKPPARAVVSDV